MPLINGSPATGEGRASALVLPLPSADDKDELDGHDWTRPDGRSLGQTLAASPAWRDLDRCVIVFRPRPRPTLALLGYLDEIGTATAEALAAQLPATLERYRPVGYPEIEAACEALADRLTRSVGEPALRESGFLAIPRGGFVVLGLLSYALRLDRKQLEEPDRRPAPLIVIDDCALTGVRFREFLDRRGKGDVVFAPLYSHPELRSAMVEREDRLRACVSGADLHDHAPDRMGDGYASWRDRWLRRSPESYWVGLPDHLSFPWSEPDVTIWNPVAGREVAGWRVAPPASCLKNRYPEPGTRGRFQIQEEGPGPLRPAASVLYGSLAEEIVVADLETGACLSLAGSAADMWRAVVAVGDVDRAGRAIAEAYDERPAVLAADLREFVARLVDRGVLVEGDADGEGREAGEPTHRR